MVRALGEFASKARSLSKHDHDAAHTQDRDQRTEDFGQQQGMERVEQPGDQKRKLEGDQHAFKDLEIYPAKGALIIVWTQADTGAAEAYRPK